MNLNKKIISKDDKIFGTKAFDISQPFKSLIFFIARFFVLRI